MVCCTRLFAGTACRFVRWCVASIAAAAPAATVVAVLIVVALPPWLVSPLRSGRYYTLTACNGLVVQLLLLLDQLVNLFKKQVCQAGFPAMVHLNLIPIKAIGMCTCPT